MLWKKLICSICPSRGNLIREELHMSPAHIYSFSFVVDTWQQVSEWHGGTLSVRPSVTLLKKNQRGGGGGGIGISRRQTSTSACAVSVDYAVNCQGNSYLRSACAWRKVNLVNVTLLKMLPFLPCKHLFYQFPCFPFSCYTAMDLLKLSLYRTVTLWSISTEQVPKWLPLLSLSLSPAAAAIT